MKIIFVFIYLLSFLLVFHLGFWVYRSKQKLWKGIVSGCLLLALLSSIFVYQQHQNQTSITSDKLLSNAQVVFTRADFEGSMVVQSIKADDAAPLWRQSFKVNKGSEVSVALYSNTVFLLWIDQKNNDLVFSALRVADGNELWRHVLGSGKSLLVPIQLKPVVIHDTVYIGINEIGSQGALANNRLKDGILSAYRVSDGKNLWNRHLPPIGTSLPLPTSRNVIVLAAEHDQLYVTVDVGLLALRASDGSEIWRSGNQTIIQIGNGIVYQVNFGGTAFTFTSVTAHRGSDGKDLWTQHFAQIESITMGTNHLYVTDSVYNGDKYKTFLYALDINTGKVLWKNQIIDPYAHFVLSNGIIYMTNVWNLEAIRETDGTLIWMKKTTDSYFQFVDFVLYRGVLFVTTSQVGTEGFFSCLGSCPVTQRIYAIAAKDGAVKWEYHPSVVSDSEGFIQIGTS